MLRKLVLAGLLALGFAFAAAPQGATAAPIGPGVALPAEAAPGMVQKTYWYYRRRFYRPRYYYRPRFYRRRYYYRPRYYRPYYYRPRYYHRRHYWRRRFFF